MPSAFIAPTIASMRKRRGSLGLSPPPSRALTLRSMGPWSESVSPPPAGYHLCMGRIAPLAAGIVAAGVVAVGGAAQAGPTRKIRVETTPEKAHVYLDDIESGAKCDATPCEFDA